jgi:hypothetical protein
MRRFIIGGIIAGALGLTAAQGAPSAHAQDTDTFHGLSPARLLDTRPGAPTVDGQSQGIGRVEGGATLALTVVGRGGVPATGVGAVALNVTVTDAQATSYLTVFPTGQPRPTTSNLNFALTGTTANAVVVDVGADGQVSLFNGAAAFPNHPTGVHLIVDVLGWFPEGSSFNGLTPARLMDTRAGGPTIDGSSSGPGPLEANASREVVVAGRGGVPADAGSVALNVTVVDPTDAGYVTTWPAGQPRPTASNLNFVAGLNRPNMVIAPLGADGSISLYNGSNGTANLLVDVMGWFPTGSSFTGVSPARLLDTRRGAPTVDGRFSGPVMIEGDLPVNVAVGGRGGVPDLAGSVALNVTVTRPTDAGYLSVYPVGVERPNASSLNFAAGQTVANMVIVPLGAGGQIKLALGGMPAPDAVGRGVGADVLVDVLGWFAGEPIASAGNPLFRSGGLGPVAFGTSYDSTIAGLQPILGPFGVPRDEMMPEVREPGLEGAGQHWNPATGYYFPTPYFRIVCAGATCVWFGGTSASDLAFAGWDSADERFVDVDGVAVGSRLADHPPTGAEPDVYICGVSVRADVVASGIGVVSDIASWDNTSYTGTDGYVVQSLVAGPKLGDLNRGC